MKKLPDSGLSSLPGDEALSEIRYYESALESPPFVEIAYDETQRQEEIESEAAKEFQVRWDKIKHNYSRSKCGRHERIGIHQRILGEVYPPILRKDLEDKLAFLLWDKSEEVLGLLRSKGVNSRPTPEQRGKAFVAFERQIRLTSFPEADQESPLYIGPRWQPNDDYKRIYRNARTVVSPNDYYWVTQRDRVATFGFPFHIAVARSEPRFPFSPYRPTRTERLMSINTDFWAAMLGGDQRLGHEIVYFEPERSFYFYDTLSGCFLVTSEGKLRLWLSLMLQERAWGQPEETASRILNEFRSKSVFDEIIAKAKAMHAADTSFFEGDGARSRLGERQLATTAIKHQDVVAAFVSAHVEVADDAVLPVVKCLKMAEKWYSLNQINPPAPKELKKYLEEVILRIHGRTIRNDLKFAEGACARGWKGLRLHIPRPETSGDDQETEPGQLSGPSNVSAPVALEAVTQLDVRSSKSENTSLATQSAESFSGENLLFVHDTGELALSR